MAKPFKPATDPRGGHVRLYWAIVDSNAWRCLGSSDQRAYVAMLRFLRSTNNGDISLALSVATQHGIKSPTTLAKCLRALVAVGLIAVTRRGGCTKGGQRLPSLYRFTDIETYANPMKYIESSKATNEWRAITTLGAGREAIRRAEAAAKAEAEAASAQSPTAKSPVHKLIATSPETGVVGHITTPKNGAWIDRPPQKMDLVKKAKSTGKPMLARVGA